MTVAGWVAKRRVGWDSDEVEDQIRDVGSFRNLVHERSQASISLLLGFAGPGQGIAPSTDGLL